MKKLIVISVIMVLTFLSWSSFTSTHAQAPANEEKPTFYHLVPGTYVNGWPRFTIHYPKDWVELRRMFMDSFSAIAPSSAPRSRFSVSVFPNPHSVDKLADIFIYPYFRTFAQDVTVLSDKPTQLQDGTPAREAETKMVMNGEPINVLNVATKKGDMWVNTGIRSYSGKIEEYQRAILYSLQFDPGKDEPVKVPPDIQEFLDRYCSANVSHDFSKLRSHFSDRYFNSGERKEEAVRKLKPLIDRITSFEIVITDFIPAGDKAYLTGFTIGWWGKSPLNEISIIKENDEWKWYGNQRDAAPWP